MNKKTLCSLMLASCIFLIIIPAQAFTADSLDITIDKNGDGIATFRFTLEGIIENSIPQSMLEAELKKGLTTSSEPPELISMDREHAVLLLKKFSDMSDVPTGTEYRTASMDFKKAEMALQNSSISSVVSADFSPASITLTFPDSYQRQFSNVEVLPAVSHTVVDPTKTPRTTASPATSSARGSLNVTSSPLDVKVYLDSRYIGEAPAVFSDIGSGTHIIGFEKEGYEPASKTVTILEGRTTHVVVVLNSITPMTTGETSSFLRSVWPVVIIALIAVSVGGFYFWSQKKKKNEMNDDEEYVKY